MELKEKVVILPGARRIGQTVAVELAREGANLAIPYRSSKEEAEKTCKTCRELGVKAVPFQADLSREEDIERLILEVKKEFGGVDILVHMAAPYPKTSLDSVTMEDFTSIQQSIGGSALILAKNVIPVMLENQGDETFGDPPGKIKGKIIFFSDWSVLVRPYTEFHPYNMAKAGVNSLTIGLARQFAPEITVNTIAPGPMLKPPDLPDEENEEALSKTPLGRWGGAEEIAKAVLYLLDADFVTGIILPVDGGRTIG